MADPVPSTHASLRWIQFADVDDDIQLAWRGGLPLADHGLHGDEARYCPHNDVVIVRKDATITTIINRDAKMRPEARRAVETALARFGDRPLDRR